MVSIAKSNMENKTLIENIPSSRTFLPHNSGRMTKVANTAIKNRCGKLAISLRLQTQLSPFVKIKSPRQLAGTFTLIPIPATQES